MSPSRNGSCSGSCASRKARRRAVSRGPSTRAAHGTEAAGRQPKRDLEQKPLAVPGWTLDGHAGKAAMAFMVGAAETAPYHSRGSLRPSNESATSTASKPTASATTRHGCSRRRSDSQPIFVQSTIRPATAPATTTSTGASTAARSSLMSKSQTVSRTSPATTRPARSEARIPGYSPSVDVENYSSGDDIVVEFLRLRFSFNAADFAQRVSAAAFKLGLVDDNELDEDETEDLVELTADGMIEEPRSELGRYLVRHWERLSLVDGESLVYWLRKLVFRGAWLDHRVKDGRLDVAGELAHGRAEGGLPGRGISEEERRLPTGAHAVLGQSVEGDSAGAGLGEHATLVQASRQHRHHV